MQLEPDFSKEARSAHIGLVNASDVSRCMGHVAQVLYHLQVIMTPEQIYAGTKQLCARTPTCPFRRMVLDFVREVTVPAGSRPVAVQRTCTRD